MLSLLHKSDCSVVLFSFGMFDFGHSLLCNLLSKRILQLLIYLCVTAVELSQQKQIG
jgi:hypothetical protein